jgi:hypothetical protein
MCVKEHNMLVIQAAYNWECSCEKFPIIITQITDITLKKERCASMVSLHNVKLLDFKLFELHIYTHSQILSVQSCGFVLKAEG